jgi:putative Holliday junction resolvase
VTAPTTPGRLLGVDFGERRIGVAVSEGRIAVPLTIVEHTDRQRDLDRVAALARDHGAEAIVVGLPLLMSGDEGEQARRSRRFGDALARLTGAPVHYHDERLSSFRAADAGPEAPPRRPKPHVDDVAATVILQSYIDALAQPEGRPQ